MSTELDDSILDRDVQDEDYSPGDEDQSVDDDDDDDDDDTEEEWISLKEKESIVDRNPIRMPRAWWLLKTLEEALPCSKQHADRVTSKNGTQLLVSSINQREHEECRQKWMSSPTMS
ncbi:E3 ubiquitin-protein ligase RNF34-like [Phyllopteryx taeniolatus]|uniref:E3 ubiquitin-protein ligase RNF34-like n=1 Tax=Phyllopteryx taeniolatus TaxID=161469 RepID=UPI002AD2ACDA|nr:E3 ubiquitin-protein ligase RNF34-like [Phyllopteryx taeniolatus]